MTIEPNSEWFNRERLTVVTVGECRDGYVEFITPDMRGMEQETDFLRDYAQNLPVTPELLERMGWEEEEEEECVEGAVYFNCPLSSESGESGGWELSVEFDGNVGVLLFCDDGDAKRLAPITTLRDLLNTLRVMGVSAEIPQEVGT